MSDRLKPVDAQTLAVLATVVPPVGAPVHTLFSETAMMLSVPVVDVLAMPMV